MAGIVGHEPNAALAADSKLSMLAMVGKPQMKAAPFDGEAYADSLPGIREELDFWDPTGLFEGRRHGREDQVLPGRRVEARTPRHACGSWYGRRRELPPLFGGDIDVSAYLAFQQTPLQTFWPAIP